MAGAPSLVGPFPAGVRGGRDVLSRDVLSPLNLIESHLWPFESHLEPFAMRGAFDGGVCALGSGCGFWLQIGLINKGYVSESWDNPRPVGPFPPGHEFSCSSAVPLVWRDVAEAAWLLEGATITECELSAAEALLCAARSLLRDLQTPPADSQLVHRRANTQKTKAGRIIFFFIALRSFLLSSSSRVV